MEDNKFKLQIVTPNRVFYDDEADMVIFQTTEGEIGVVNNHIPLTTTLISGKTIIKKDGDEKYAVMHGGFVEINEDIVTILTDAAEWPEEIDVERAKAAKKRAEDRIQDEHDYEVRAMRSRIALQRALVRIELAEIHNSTSK